MYRKCLNLTNKEYNQQLLKAQDSPHSMLSTRDVRIIMPDLRNHGLSAHMTGFHPPHTLESTAQDLLAFVDTKLGGRMPQLIVGLSLGGKVSLEILQQLQQQQNALEEAKGLREREQHTESVETSGHVLVPRPQQVGDGGSQQDGSLARGGEGMKGIMGGS
jgi:hypothetical protein